MRRLPGGEASKTQVKRHSKPVWLDLQIPCKNRKHLHTNFVAISISLNFILKIVFHSSSTYPLAATALQGMPQSVSSRANSHATSSSSVVSVRRRCCTSGGAGQSTGPQTKRKQRADRVKRYPRAEGKCKQWGQGGVTPRRGICHCCCCHTQLAFHRRLTRLMHRICTV